MAKKSQRKWDHLVGKVPTITTEEPERMDQIDILRQFIIEEYQKENDGKLPPTGYLVSQYLGLRDAKDALKQKMSDLQLEIDALTKMIAERYEAEGVTAIDTPDGRVGMHYEPHAIVVDKDALRDWAIKNGLERSLTLPWPTVNSELKRALEEGKAVYDGEKLVGGPLGVNVFLITKFRKGQ